MTADTVAVETPAVLATSLMVAAIAPQQIDLAHYRPVAVARKAFKGSASKSIIPAVTDFSACAARRIGEFSAKRLVTFFAGVGGPLGREGI